MGIVVLLELVEPLDAQILRVGEDPVDPLAVLKVHAAASDPGPLTACGLDTSDMVADPWQPDRPGRQWHPPRWADRICLSCDAAVRAG